MILKLLVKRIVKGMYFYLFEFIILLEYEVNFDIYFVYNLWKKFLMDFFVIYYLYLGYGSI